MIYIKEKTSRKITGATSLFLYFKKNDDILKIVKSINYSQRTYHPDEHSFEVPLTELSFLLDNLTPLDDIKLELCQEEKIKDVELKGKYKLTPFPHQIDAIKYGLAKERFLLLDAPGLGKTLSLICLAEELKIQKGIKHCLVVCGVASLMTNWKKEIEKSSNLSCRVLGEKISKKGNISYSKLEDRAKELPNIEEFFIITNIESFREKSIEVPIKRGPSKGKTKKEVTCPILNAIEKLCSPDELFSIIDEAHAVKNQNAKQTSNFKKLKCKYKAAATGTLLLNNPLEAYTSLKWIDKEKMSPSEFEHYYCVYGGYGNHQIKGFQHIDVLKDEIESCSLRRTKDLLDLPPKTIINEYVNLEPDQEEFYENVVNGIREECDKVKLSSNNVLAMTVRLRQASVLPSILTSKEITSAKINRCIDLVHQLTSQGEKVVVMSTFKEPIFELEKKLKDLKPLVCIGTTKAATIQQNKELFQENNNYLVMLCTWQKMGTGHTLNRASYMIFLDTPWTYGVFDQSCDRIHRIGSKNPVFIYNLIATNTIDEKVKYLLEKKKAISEFIVDGVLDDNTYEILKDYIEGL